MPNKIRWVQQRVKCGGGTRRYFTGSQESVHRGVVAMIPSLPTRNRRGSPSTSKDRPEASEIDAARHAAEFSEVRSDALQGQADDAIRTLEQAVASGSTAKWALRGDPDLVSIRLDPRSQKIIAGM